MRSGSDKPMALGRPWGLIAIVAVLAVAVGSVLALSAATGRDHRSAAADRPAPASPPAARRVPLSAATGGLRAGSAGAGSWRAFRGHRALHLVLGSQLMSGIYTRYPRSRAGAISAAVEFVTELGSTLDPDAAATVARLTASPSYAAAAQDAAAGAVASRRKLGLRAAGPVPPGTAVVLVPVMYQLRDASPAQLTVLLLFDYTQMTAAGIREHLGVTRVRLGWTTASWRLLPPVGTESGPALTGLLATPGTASATAKGWEAMTDAL
jgi:hypothetical protein